MGTIEAVPKRRLSGRSGSQTPREMFPRVAGGGGRGQVKDDGAGWRIGGVAQGNGGTWAAGVRSVLWRADGAEVACALALGDEIGRRGSGFQGAGVAGRGGWREDCLLGRAWGCALNLRRDDPMEVGAADGWVLGVAEAGEFGGEVGGCGCG